MVATALLDLGVGLAKKIAGRFFAESMTEDERAAADRELLAMIQAESIAWTNAQRDVLVAELTQGDNFTKRARPWIIYAGLILVGVNSVLFALLNGLVILLGAAEAGAVTFSAIAPPPEFWVAWGGAVSVYVWKRDQTKQLGMRLARNGG